MRTKEFGSSLPRGIAPGMREVTMTLELFGQDDEATTGTLSGGSSAFTGQRDVSDWARRRAS